MGLEKELKIERMEALGHLRAYNTGALKGMFFFFFYIYSLLFLLLLFICYLLRVIVVHDMLTQSWLVYCKILSLDS